MIAHGSLVDVEGAGPALVTAIYADRIEAAPIAGEARIDAAMRGARPFTIPCGDLAGRTIDCIGRPVDGRPLDGPRVPVFGRDPYVLPAEWERLSLGAMVFDLKQRIPVGASLIAVGDRELAQHIVRHQRSLVICTGPRFAPHHVHVVPPVDATPTGEWLVPWTAMAIADGLRRRGRRVFVYLDDIAAWQPHVDQHPQRGTWPTQLAQLASRAYGTASLLARCAATTLDITSAFDTLIDLARFATGDIGRIASKLVSPPVRVRSPQLLARMLFRREYLRYRPNMPTDTVEQIACLLAAAMHDGLDVDAYLAQIRASEAERLERIRVAQRFEDEDERILIAAAAVHR